MHSCAQARCARLDYPDARSARCKEWMTVRNQGAGVYCILTVSVLIKSDARRPRPSLVDDTGFLQPDPCCLRDRQLVPVALALGRRRRTRAVEVSLAHAHEVLVLESDRLGTWFCRLGQAESADGGIVRSRQCQGRHVGGRNYRERARTRTRAGTVASDVSVVIVGLGVDHVVVSAVGLVVVGVVHSPPLAGDRGDAAVVARACS